MKSPGILLREAREARGLTIAEVASMTRIPRATIKYIEDDCWEEFEADIFVRGHLKNYAREMRLDCEQIMRAYERRGGKKATTVADVTVEPPAATSGVDFSLSFLKAQQKIGATHLLAIGLVLVGLILLVGLFSQNKATAQNPAQFETTSESDWSLDRDVQETRWLLEQPTVED